MIQYQKEIAPPKETLRITTRVIDEKSGGNAKRIEDELHKTFPEAKFAIESVNHVGPTVGREIKETAIVASLIAMLGILMYVAFRYEFSFALGAVIAIIHDILM